MKREIKFRGLRTDGKGWVYGVPITIKQIEENLEDSINVACIITGCDWNGVFGFMPIPNDLIIEVTPESIGQFTGLKDKNGVDIYEGDILKESRLNGLEFYYKVFYKKGGLVINTHQDDFNKPTEHIFFYESIADMQNSCFIETLEIIGNIHE